MHDAYLDVSLMDDSWRLFFRHQKGSRVSYERDFGNNQELTVLLVEIENYWKFAKYAHPSRRHTKWTLAINNTIRRWRSWYCEWSILRFDVRSATKPASVVVLVNNYQSFSHLYRLRIHDHDQLRGACHYATSQSKRQLPLELMPDWTTARRVEIYFPREYWERGKRSSTRGNTCTAIETSLSTRTPFPRPQCSGL